MPLLIEVYYRCIISLISGFITTLLIDCNRYIIKKFENYYTFTDIKLNVNDALSDTKRVYCIYTFLLT